MNHLHYISSDRLQFLDEFYIFEIYKNEINESLGFTEKLKLPFHDEIKNLLED